MSKHWGFYMDLTRCIGCGTCEMACRDYQGVWEGESWITVMTDEHGEYPHPLVVHRPVTCYHCEIPLCANACPVQAIARDPDSGIVTLNSSLCTGCGACRTACPFHAPRWDPVREVMGKCDFCQDRLQKGLTPICVDACPMRALAAGPLDQLIHDFPRGESLPTEDHGLDIGPGLWIRPKLK